MSAVILSRRGFDRALLSEDGALRYSGAYGIYEGDIALAFSAFGVGKFFKREIMKEAGIKIIVITIFEALATRNSGDDQHENDIWHVMELRSDFGAIAGYRSGQHDDDDSPVSCER